MARGERNARHDDRSPGVDPYFDPRTYGAMAGYQQPDGRDFTGYSSQDGELASRLGELPMDPEVRAPLGGPVVGRLAVSSYGGMEGPTPGGYLVDLAEYQRHFDPLAPGSRGIEDDGGAGFSVARQSGGLPGASSIRARLGIPWGQDDTGFAGVGAGPLPLTEQHAFAKAPTVDSTGIGVGVAGPSAAYNGVVAEHVLSRIRGYAAAGIYDGGDGNGFGVSRGRFAGRVDFDTAGYPTVVSQLDVGEDGAGFVGGGDFGRVSPSGELADIRRENDSGDEFQGDGWERPASSYARVRNRNQDYDR